MKHTALKTQLVGLLFGTALLTLVGISMLSYSSMEQLIEANGQVIATQEAINSLQNIMLRLDEAETGQRGFLLTNDEAYLQPYISAQITIATSLSAIEQQFAPDAIERTEIELLQRIVKARFAELQDAIEIRRTAGFDAALAVVLSHRGKVLMDQLRTLVTAQEVKLLETLDSRVEATRAQTQSTLLAFASGSVSGLGLLLLVFLMLSFENERRQRVEQDLQRAHSELELRVQERTAQLQASHDALQASEARYRELVELMPEPIAVHHTGTLLYVNPAAIKLLGAKDASELVGRSILDLVHPDYRALVERRVRELRQSNAALPLLEEKFLRLDGQVIDAEVMAVPVRFGQTMATQVILRDISAQKRAAAQNRFNTARAEALARIAALLNAQLEHDAVLDTVCTEAAHALEVPIVALRLYDPKRDALLLAAHFGLPAALAQNAPPIPRAAIEACTAQHGPIAYLPDVQNERDYPLREAYAPFGIRSEMLVRLQRECELIGCLSIATIGETRSFTTDERDLLQTIANLATQALSNARLYVEARRRADEFSSLYETTHDLAAETNLPTLLQTIVERAMQLLDAPSGAIFLYHAQQREVEVAVTRGTFPRPNGTRMALGDGMAGRVAQTRQPLIIADYSKWEGRSPIFQGSPLTAVVGVPMLYQGEIIGVLAVTETGETSRRFDESDARLLSLFASQAAAAVHNARLFNERELHLTRLQGLRQIDLIITSSLDLHMTLDMVLTEVKAQLQVDAVSVLLLNPNMQMLEHVVGHGFRTRLFKQTNLRLGQGWAGRAALERALVAIPDVRAADPGLHAEAAAAEGFVTYYGVPLIAKGEVKGVLEIFQRSPLEPTQKWLDYLMTLGGQVAIAIDNNQMFSGLQRSSMELALAYDTTLEGWSRALDLRDRETEGHTLRVTELTLKLARDMLLRDRELINVRRGALLHDIGKMGIPDAILLKPGALNDAEWHIMRKHPQYAYNLLSPITFLRSALDIPYCHHEKWDGTGYPRSLKGEQVPLAARIFAVVDVWDALSSDRPYRPAWPAARVHEHIASLSGSHFDPQVVEVFLKLIR